MILAWQILVVVVLVLLGGFFSGAETGVYRLSRFRLRIGLQQKRKLFTLLADTIQDSHALVLSMLLGTNLANYLVTCVATYMLLGATQSEHLAELYATAIMAPVLFVFSELIPKNIYFYRADVLMPRYSPLLWVVQKVFTVSGIVPLLKLISGGFAATESAITARPRAYLSRVIHETREEELLSPVQTDIMDRLVKIPGIRLSAVMTPISNVQMVNVNTDATALLSRLQGAPFTRLPVYQDRRDNVIGYVNIYKALACEKQFTDLREFVTPIPTLSGVTGILDAINKMRKDGEKIVLVTQPHRYGRTRPSGIVTMKDLAEELTGELAEW